MKLEKMKKEDLELLSYKDITYYILEEQGKKNTAALFKEIVTLLSLPASSFEQKIGDYYTSLTTDKRFIMLEDGCWDLKNHHTSDKLIKVVDKIDTKLLGMAKGSTGSDVGTGGMATKLTAAKIATLSGADMVIANGGDFHNIHRIVEGGSCGTLFVGQKQEEFYLIDYIEKLL